MQSFFYALYIEIACKGEHLKNKKKNQEVE